MKFTGENRNTRGNTCPNATLSITNPTWTDPVLKPCLRGGRPGANRLSSGTANVLCVTFHVLRISSVKEVIFICDEHNVKPNEVVKFRRKVIEHCQLSDTVAFIWFCPVAHNIVDQK
jgi:hypothetical protein